MKLFLILLILISSFSLVCAEKWLISAIILVTVFIIVSLKYRSNRLFLIFLIFLCIIGITFSLLKIRTFQSNGSFIGIVIVKKENYVILFDGLEKIYFKTSESNIDIFDVIRVNGSLCDLLPYKRPIESGFDFTKYMNNSGVFREINSNTYTTIFNNPINIVQYKIKVLDMFNGDKSQLLAKTILFGDSSYDNEFYVRIKSAGLLILISSSGLIVNGLYYLITDFLSKFLKKKHAHLISFIFIFPYFLLNIDSPSIFRVFVGRAIILYCAFKNEKYNSLCIKTIPFLLVILFDRYLCNNIGILLACVVSFTLYFSSFILRKQNFLVKKIVFFVILGVTLFPFNFYFNNCFNVVNNMINIVFIPILRILLALLTPTYLGLKLPLIDRILDSYYNVLELLNFKYLNLNGPPFNQYFISAYYMLFFAFLFFFEVKNKHIYKKISYIFVATMTIYFVPINNYIVSKISFINVGQGDSTLITYKGINILVDTGGSLKEDIATNCLIPYLRKQKIYHLDYVFITHYDMDHYHALDSLKRNFIVNNVFDYNYCPAVKFHNLSIYNINRDISNVVEENDKSLVLYVKIESNTFLLMGDASKNVEYRIIKEYPNLDVDYLKCGHHGSNTSTSEEFIETITPNEAIISCGENNKYGHPNKEVISTLTKYNVEIRRTDTEGTITYKFFA